MPDLLINVLFQAEVTHRLSNAKEAASRSAALESHEDLAKKLQVIDRILDLYLLWIIYFRYLWQSNTIPAHLHKRSFCMVAVLVGSF